jgi:hypothetical protein
MIIRRESITHEIFRITNRLVHPKQGKYNAFLVPLPDKFALTNPNLFEANKLSVA